MKKTLFFLVIICFACNYKYFAQENGGPYVKDTNTVLLLHFDGNLDEIASGFLSNNFGVEKSFIESHNSVLGNAIHFDNSNQENNSYITIPNSSTLNLSGSWTIEFWFSIKSWDKSFNNWPVPIVLPSTGWEANYFLEIPSTTGQLKYGFSSNNGQVTVFSSNNSISTNTWYHVALINDYEDKKIKLVLHNSDFIKIEEQSITYPSGTIISTGTQDVKIGAGIAGDNFFDGYMDELRISNCVRDFSSIKPVLPPLQNFTSDIEFYSNDDHASYWPSISQAIQNEFNELCSLWHRPGSIPLLPESKKIKIYLLTHTDFIKYVNTIIPSWKCGWFENDTYTIVVTLPQTDEQKKIYSTFEELVASTLAQLLLSIHCINENGNQPPQYFCEGFGLYRSGYRVNSDFVSDFLNNQTDKPDISFISDLSETTFSSKKDLLVSYIEAQVLGVSYENLMPDGNVNLWHDHLKHFYKTVPENRIALRYQSENFDIYSIPRDLKYLEPIADKLETVLNRYKMCYDLTIPHMFNVVIYPDEQTGMEFTDREGIFYNGGTATGGDNFNMLSPEFLEDGIDEAINGLLGHEFFHVIHFKMKPKEGIPNGIFHSEGLADYMAADEYDPKSYMGFYQVKELLTAFNSKFGRDPMLQEIMENQYKNDPQIGSFDPYMFGSIFYDYLFSEVTDYIKVKDFFYNCCDWSVFDISYSAIDSGYINYLKRISGIIISVSGQDNLIPTMFNLDQNFPNPFNPSTKIKFALPKNLHTKLIVYDLIGREIQTLIDKEIEAGYHEINFNANSIAGGLSSGVYFYKIQAGDFIQTKKLVLIK